MSRESAADLLVLHAVRLLGFANTDAVAARFDIVREEAEAQLDAAEAEGRVEHVEFFDVEGWSLTESGRRENERRLAAERAVADPGDAIAAVYRDFLPLNARLLRAVTEWQIAPTAADRFAPNDHADVARDRLILNELASLGAEVSPLTQQLTGILARFDGYGVRFAAALGSAERGSPDWVDKTDRDSCHRVWFQLHEDLIATLGIDRRSGV